MSGTCKLRLCCWLPLGCVLVAAPLQGRARAWSGELLQGQAVPRDSASATFELLVRNPERGKKSSKPEFGFAEAQKLEKGQTPSCF